MGAAVFAGMIGVTAAGLFLTPVFYVLLQRRARVATQAAIAAGALVPAPATSLENHHG
jgi:HAE1 family hydrophobic/amphiphilic exporter-1